MARAQMARVGHIARGALKEEPQMPHVVRGIENEAERRTHSSSVARTTCQGHHFVSELPRCTPIDTTGHATVELILDREDDDGQC